MVGVFLKGSDMVPSATILSEFRLLVVLRISGLMFRTVGKSPKSQPYSCRYSSCDKRNGRKERGNIE
jgi:hypothetical protein